MDLFGAAYPNEDLGQKKIRNLQRFVDIAYGRDQQILGFCHIIIVDRIFQAESQGKFCPEFLRDDGCCDRGIVRRTVQKRSHTVVYFLIVHMNESSFPDSQTVTNITYRQENW